MIRLHERQLAMLVLHFCLRYTIQCISRVQQGPQSSILFRMGPHQIVPSQAILSQSDTGNGNSSFLAKLLVFGYLACVSSQSHIIVPFIFNRALIESSFCNS